MSITRPLGFRAAATIAGLKPSGKPDLALIVCDGGAAAPVPTGKSIGHAIDPRRTAAAVFTRNQVLGAPIHIGRAWRESALRGGPGLRAILINAGCSNAATGQPGIEDANKTMKCVAEHLGGGCNPGEVLPSSTGIIGHRLPVDKINAAVPGLFAKLSRGHETDDAAAAAIMTTDLVAKQAHREIEVKRHVVHLGAIAKGSGMIAPRLDSTSGGGPQGTMLAFLTTDAAVEMHALQRALEHAARESFDRVSVDAHPSCSDSLVIMASGSAPVKAIHEHEPEFHIFQAALTSMCQDLAEKVVRDGEGATRVFRCTVRGAANASDAERIARAIVDSPLVKCAIHGRDPNWGRIVTAAGNAGVPFDPENTSLSIGGVEVYRAGVPTGVGKADAKLLAAMNSDPVEVVLSVGGGGGGSWLMGCDLSANYVRINADYTT